MKNYIDNTKKGFNIKKNNGVTFLTVPDFEKAGFIKHCFTSRLGGVSEGCFTSLNLSITRESNPLNKEKNFKNVCDAIDVNYASLVLVNYSHGDGIYNTKKIDAQKGFNVKTDLPFCDALVVANKEITGVTLHADCIPVFVADIQKKITAVCHAGYKGVFLQLPQKLINYFIEKFNSSTKDIIVGLGPHIMDCCFETQKDVYQEFSNKFGEDVLNYKDGKTYINMQACVLKQLEEVNVNPNNVTLANLCTYCNEELFFSHRRDKGNTGAMGSFITIY